MNILRKAGEWQLSPAYDLTYSNSIGGEHATTIAGEGRSPSITHLLHVAKKAGIRELQACQIAQHIHEIVQESLGKYLNEKSDGQTSFRGYGSGKDDQYAGK